MKSVSYTHLDVYKRQPVSDTNQASITHFKNLATLVAWEEALGSHVYIENADLVMRGNTCLLYTSRCV